MGDQFLKSPKMAHFLDFAQTYFSAKKYESNTAVCQPKADPPRQP